MLRRELKTNFDEFSACSDAEAVFGGVVRVSVIVAPRDILLMIQMANDRHRDQNDDCADDESSTYQLFHLISSRLDPRKRGKTDTPEPSPRDMSYVTPLSQKHRFTELACKTMLTALLPAWADRHLGQSINCSISVRITWDPPQKSLRTCDLRHRAQPP